MVFLIHAANRHPNPCQLPAQIFPASLSFHKLKKSRYHAFEFSRIGKINTEQKKANGIAHGDPVLYLPQNLERMDVPEA